MDIFHISFTYSSSWAVNGQLALVGHGESWCTEHQWMWFLPDVCFHCSWLCTSSRRITEELLDSFYISCSFTFLLVLIVDFFFFLVLGITLRTLYLQGRHSATELNPRPFYFFILWQGLDKLPKLYSNLQSSCLSFPASWIYRWAPPLPAHLGIFINYYFLLCFLPLKNVMEDWPCSLAVEPIVWGPAFSL